MSRIGRAPITVPAGVEVTVGEGNRITVKGPKGTLTQQCRTRRCSSTVENGVLHVTRPNDEKQNRALHGLTRTLVNNMVVGVTEGFSQDSGDQRRRLPCAKGGQESRDEPRLQPPGDRVPRSTGSQSMFPVPTTIVIKGIDKQMVGQFAADVRDEESAGAL